MNWRLLQVMMVSANNKNPYRSRQRHRPLKFSRSSRSSSRSSSSSTTTTTPDSTSHSGFTYFLRVGRQAAERGPLYVPITSYCNARTLPETRGPNFHLPAVAVAALCHVRMAERQQTRWGPWCQWLNVQEEPQKLPPPEFDVAPDYYLSVDLSTRRPTVSELMEEIDDVMEFEDLLGIVIAGEGEPTLAMDKLLDLLRGIRKYYKDVPIRIITNGIVESSIATTKLIPTAQELSVSFSVALMTNDATLYGQLMDVDPSKHVMVLEFIRHLIDAQLIVEATGVDREPVNKIATERLAKETLGVTTFRWRPYFL